MKFKHILRRIIFKSYFLCKIYYSFFHKKGIAIERDVFEHLKKIKSLNDDELGAISEINLKKMISYCKQNVPYYFELNDLESRSDFHSLPILSKTDYRENLHKFISREFSERELSLRNTGGSTGEPFEFYSDKLSGFRDNAHHWYLYSLMEYQKGDIIVSCGGFEIPEAIRKKNIYWRENPKGYVFGDVAFSALYITDENIEFYLNKLISLKPKILRGYPSFFDRLASYILENNIKISFNIKGVNLTAEMCSLSQRMNIEKAFAARVYFEYGHTEISIYCYTCDNDYVYRSSPLYGYVEVLDENGNDVPEGGIGKIVVTGFNNFGMPFVRYDTGDLGELIKRNRGFVKFRAIHGRSQDYLLTSDLQKVYLTALIFGQHLHAFKNIKKWQLYQDEPGKVVIRIVKGDYYTKDDEDEIKVNFSKVSGFILIFDYVDFISSTVSGKHLFLKQNVIL